MLVFFVCTFAFIFGGSRALDAWLTARYVAQLPPAAVRAGNDLEAMRLPDPDDLRVLVQASGAGHAEGQMYSDLGLTVLTLLAAAGAMGLAVAVAMRLARPIERVADAARLVAMGTLSARVQAEPGASVELNGLIGDFNRMADHLSASRRELKESTAAVAHELRTPLTILRGRLQGIHDRVFPSGPAEIAALIQQVESLSRIVEDLRVVSLADTSALSLQCQTIDLAAAVNGLLPAIEPDLRARGLKLELDLRRALTRADPQRLRQVLNAVLDNAQRYAGAGTELRIETCEAGPDGVLRVLDRGPGFPPGAADRAFERFWRSDESRSRETGGSGLGLSVVRAIVQAHGGRCSAANRAGGGAIVEIKLPCPPRIDASRDA